MWKNNCFFHFDVGGIAKGYIAEKVSENLKENGFPRHLIDAGGDLVAGDAPTNAEGWRIAVELPQSDIMMAKSLLVQNQAVATSGSTYQYYNHGSKRHSHIIDPAKGEGISKTDNVTIISPSGADADWLATACSILSFKKSKKLIGLVPHSTMIRTFIREGKIMTMMTGKKVKFTD